MPDVEAVPSPPETTVRLVESPPTPLRVQGAKHVFAVQAAAVSLGEVVRPLPSSTLPTTARTTAPSPFVTTAAAMPTTTMPTTTAANRPTTMMETGTAVTDSLALTGWPDEERYVKARFRVDHTRRGVLTAEQEEEWSDWEITTNVPIVEKRGYYEVVEVSHPLVAASPPRRKKRKRRRTPHVALVSREDLGRRKNAWTQGPYQVEVPVTPEGLLLRIALYRGRPCFLGYVPQRNGLPGPAQVRNLLADRFDVLVAIDQVSIVGWDFPAVVSLLRRHGGQPTRRLGFLPGQTPLAPPPLAPPVSLAAAQDSDDEVEVEPEEALVAEEEDDDEVMVMEESPTPAVRLDDSDVNSSDDDDDVESLEQVKTKRVALTPGSSGSERDSDFQVSDREEAADDDEELQEAMGHRPTVPPTGGSQAAAANGTATPSTGTPVTGGAAMPTFRYPTHWPANFGPPLQTANQATADSRMAVPSRGPYANNQQILPNFAPLYFQNPGKMGANQANVFQAQQTQMQPRSITVPAEYTVALPVLSNGGLGIEVGNLYGKMAVLSTPALGDGTPNLAAGLFRNPCDYIVAVDGTRVHNMSFADITTILKDHHGRSLRMLVMRDKRSCP
jgi:hypothetical protein